MKAADGWLHNLGVPLAYVEALFEHVPQTIGLLLGLVPLAVFACVVRCSWIHRHRILSCCGGTESNQTSKNISNQFSHQITNQRVGGSGFLLPPKTNKNFYKMAPQTPNAPPLPNLNTMINIHNNNASNQIKVKPNFMNTDPNRGHRSTACWPNEFQAMLEDACFKFYNNHRWRNWDPKHPKVIGRAERGNNLEQLQAEVQHPEPRPSVSTTSYTLPH
jgi:hypothetical protein